MPSRGTPRVGMAVRQHADAGATACYTDRSCMSEPVSPDNSRHVPFRRTARNTSPTRERGNWLPLLPRLRVWLVSGDE